MSRGAPIAVALVLSSGCFSDSGTGGDEGGECPVGQQGCACTDQATCALGLECTDNVCQAVAATTTTSGSGGGTMGAGSTAGSTATPIDCEADCPAGRCVEDLCVMRVFVSSEVHAGDQLGGLVGADAICQRLADAELLGGRWMAWLSDGTIAVRERFEPSGGPYELVDGTPIASSWDALLASGVLEPINRDEAGRVPPTTMGDCAESSVWTGTLPGGFPNPPPVNTPPEPHCNDWMGDGLGRVGDYNAEDEAWTSACTPSDCVTRTAPLYCFEQVPL